MGMSASQARFLSLTARKNNVEFEGQQINQQRTTLSNESAAYYSELCNMNVPTPPSVDDYTKISYTFNDGAMTNTITSILAKGSSSSSAGKYSISYIEQWQDDYSVVSTASSLVQAENDYTKFRVGTDNLRVLGNVGVSKATLESMTDETFESRKSGYTTITNDKYLNTLTRSQIIDLLEEEEYYRSMLNNATDKGTNYHVRYIKNTTTGAYVPYFYSTTDLQSQDKYTGDTKLANIDCFSILFHIIILFIYYVK